MKLPSLIKLKLPLYILSIYEYLGWSPISLIKIRSDLLYFFLSCIQLAMVMSISRWDFTLLATQELDSLFQYGREALSMLHQGPLVKLLGGDQLFRTVPAFTDGINMMLCLCIWCSISQAAVLLLKRFHWRTMDNQYYSVLRRQTWRLIFTNFQHYLCKTFRISIGSIYSIFGKHLIIFGLYLLIYLKSA